MKTKIALVSALICSALSIQDSYANGPLPKEYALNLATTDVVSAGNVSELNGVSQFTIEVKVKLDTVTRYSKVVRKQLDKNNRIHLQIDNGKLLAVVANGANTYKATSSAVIGANKWHHIALVFDGTQSVNSNRVKMYLDGELQTLSGNKSWPATTSTNTADVLIGSPQFDGSIDELRVWETALSSADIALWRQRRLNDTHNDFDDLALYWQFDDAASSNTVAAQQGTTYAGTSTSNLNYEVQKTYDIYGYLPSYRVNGISADAFNHVTHAVYKSVKAMSDGSLHPNLNGDPTKALVSDTLYELKNKVGDRPVSILLGVGGGERSGNGEFIPSIAASPALRQALADSLKEYCFTHGLNGVDINWEFPHGATEIANWTALLQTLYQTLNAEGLLLTASYRARNGSFSYIPLSETVDLARDTQDYLDLFSVQVYNRYDSNGLHVPYHTFEQLSNDYADASGMDKSKLMSAAAFYGRGVTSKSYVMKYNDIINKTGNAAGVETITGPSDDVVYNHVADPKAPKGNYSFNGVNTNVEKATYIYDKGLTGLMIWEIGTDVEPSSEHSLLKAINEVLPINSDKVAPTPGFNVNSTSVTVGGSVNFTDTSSHVPTAWSWSFPGGSPSVSTGQNPTVTYATAGTYPVTLSVTNSAGTKTITRTALITVSN